MRENSFTGILLQLSYEKLLEYIDNPQKYEKGALLAAAWLLIDRGHNINIPLVDIPETNTDNPKYANFGRRYLAKIIDGFILLIIAFPLMWLFSSSLAGFVFSTSLAIVIGLLYNTVLTYSNNGATFGKQAVKIKVVQTNYTPVSLYSSIMRDIANIMYRIVRLVFAVSLFFLIDQSAFAELGFGQKASLLNTDFNVAIPMLNILFTSWYWLEAMVMLFNKKKKSIHDFIADTVVVRERPDYTNEKKYNELAKEVNDLVPKFES